MFCFDEKSQPDEETFGRPIWKQFWTGLGGDLEPEKGAKTTQNLNAFLDLKKASIQIRQVSDKAESRAPLSPDPSPFLQYHLIPQHNVPLRSC